MAGVKWNNSRTKPEEQEMKSKYGSSYNGEKKVRLPSRYLCACLSELSRNKTWVSLMHTLPITSKSQHAGPDTKALSPHYRATSSCSLQRPLEQQFQYILVSLLYSLSCRLVCVKTNICLLKHRNPSIYFKLKGKISLSVFSLSFAQLL